MADLLQRFVDEVGRVVLGKEEPIRQALCCLLARGHLLVEDLPGVGKTTLSQVFARAAGLDYQRVQCTSDLLPADILGVSVFDRDNNRFQFHPGPIFTQFLLVDEINRASPKTQSALLEAMAEYQVTVEGQTRALPEPFFVMATQNPWFQSGTFPLPESQLDRFLMRISLGYPDQRAERRLLLEGNPRQFMGKVKAVFDSAQVLSLQATVDQIRVSDNVVSYLQRLVAFTREDAQYAYGLSSRAAMSLLQCARAWALIEGRDYVLPDDIQYLLEPVTGHRLKPSAEGQRESMDLIQRLLTKVPVVV